MKPFIVKRKSIQENRIKYNLEFAFYSSGGVSVRRIGGHLPGTVYIKSHAWAKKQPEYIELPEWAKEKGWK